MAPVLGGWFASYGVPEKLLTDGGPPFNGSAFTQFCQEFGVVHVRSSPQHHESNGHAEARVKEAKTLLRKSGPFRSPAFFKALMFLASCKHCINYWGIESMISPSSTENNLLALEKPKRKLRVYMY